MTRPFARPAHLVPLLAILAAWVCGGCAAMPDERRATFGIDFRVPDAPDLPSAILFMVDGVNADIFNQMLEEGRLPNIRKYFVDRGLYTNRCVASVPSVTLANETSLMTGVFPGRHGITGIGWFDRVQLVHRSYEELAEKNTLDGDYIAPTLYERLFDRTTLSLFFQAHRGATKFVENWTTAGPPYAVGWYGFVDRISLWRFDIVANIARAQREYPALVVSYTLSPDMQGYEHGVTTDVYRGALEHTDAHIGRVLRDLEAAGRLEKTVIALVADHGLVDVSRHWRIKDFFRNELRLAVNGEGKCESTPFEDRLTYYDKITCVLMGSGDRYWEVYLRKPSPPSEDRKAPLFGNWLARPTPEDMRAYPNRDGKRVNVLDQVIAAEGVDMVAYRAGPNRVHLAGKKGTVELSRAADGRKVAMRVVQGDDPLGYRDTVPAAMLDGSPHDDREWLAATANSPYPDVVPQVMAFFDAPRAADIAVFAAEGWDFSKDKKGGHGGLRPGEMLTIFTMAGPGVPHERRAGPIRSVDVAPTLLQLLGRPVPTDIDGRSLLPK